VGPGFCPEFGCRALPRPERLAGQRLRRRPDKCDAGRRPSGRRIPRPAASGRTRSLCRSSSSHRNRFAGFRREPCWGGDKTPVLHFFGISVWGWYHYPPAAVAVSEQPRAGFISAEKRLSQSGCSAPMDACCSLLHTVLFWHLYAWGGITTLGVRFMLLKRWTPAGHGGVFAVLCRPGARPVRAESPLVGYTRHPSP